MDQSKNQEILKPNPWVVVGILILIFLLTSFVVMLSWNYVLPTLWPNKIPHITLFQALVLLILARILFSR